MRIRIEPKIVIEIPHRHKVRSWVAVDEDQLPSAREIEDTSLTLIFSKAEAKAFWKKKGENVSHGRYQALEAVKEGLIELKGMEIDCV